MARGLIGKDAYLLEMPTSFPTNSVPAQYQLVSTTKAVRRYTTAKLQSELKSLSDAEDDLESARRRASANLCVMFDRFCSPFNLSIVTCPHKTAVSRQYKTVGLCARCFIVFIRYRQVSRLYRFQRISLENICQWSFFRVLFHVGVFMEECSIWEKHVAPGTILCGAARLLYSLSLTRCLLLQRPLRALMVSPCAEQKFSTV